MSDKKAKKCSMRKHLCIRIKKGFLANTMDFRLKILVSAWRASSLRFSEACCRGNQHFRLLHFVTMLSLAPASASCPGNNCLSYLLKLCVCNDRAVKVPSPQTDASSQCGQWRAILQGLCTNQNNCKIVPVCSLTQNCSNYATCEQQIEAAFSVRGS